MTGRLVTGFGRTVLGVVAIAIVVCIWLGLLGILPDDNSARTGSAAKASFCDTHACIASFDDGHGAIVQCADGMWSHSGGLPGACSWHGGER